MAQLAFKTVKPRFIERILLASFWIGALASLYSFQHSPTYVGAQHPIGHLDSIGGCRVRERQDLLWHRLSDGPVYDGELVSTEAGGATIRPANGPEIFLEPGVFGVVERGPDQGAQFRVLGRSTSVAQWLAMPPSSSSELFSSEYAETRLLVTLPKTDGFAENLARLQTRLRQQLGHTLVLEYTHNVEPLPADFELPPKLKFYSTRPVFPRVGQIFHGDKRSPCIELSWSQLPVASVKFIVEVAKARTFKYFRSFGASSNHMKLRISKNTDIFWRIRATKNGQAELSDSARFSVALNPNEVDIQRRALAGRVRSDEAWLSDIQICE